MRFSLRALVRVCAATLIVAASLAVTVSQTPRRARALAACTTTAQNNYTMAASHGKVFYIDTGVNPVLDAGYVGYRFTNATGSTQKNLWVSLSNFAGGKVNLANPDDQYFKLADTANNSTSTAYFMLKATGGTNTAQTHDVKLWDRRPDLTGATALYQCTYSFTKVQETIKAAANKVADNTGDSVAITASTTSPKLGETVTITVEGATGTIGNGSAPDNSIVWLTPAAISSWPTRALRLESVSAIFDTNKNWNSTGDQVTFTDQLLVANAKTVVGASEYRATYTFRVIGRPTSSVKVVPVTQIASGTQVKHSDTGAAGATLDLSFSSFTVNAAVAKSVTSSTGLSTIACSAGSCSSWGGTDGITYLIVPYRLTTTSSSATASTIDELVDVPAVGAKFFTDGTRLVKVTDANNTNATWSSPTYAASESGMSPRPQHFVGPFTFSSSRSLLLDYWMAVPNASGTYSNTAYAMVGSTPVGTSGSAMSQVNVTTSGGTSASVTVTTQAFPVSAITSPASSITTTGATLNGVVDPNGTATLTGEFEWSPNADMSSATTVTATTPASGSLNGLVDPTNLAVSITGLSQYTTYYFRVKAGSTYGGILSFTTLGTAAPPTATTNAAGPTSLTAAVLNGTINPNLTTINGVQFLYSSTSSTLASGVTTVTVADSADATLPILLSGLSPQVVSYSLTAGTLVAGTTYYYKVRACPNGSATISGYTCGTGFVDGAIVSFTPGTAPVVATSTLPSSLKSAAYSTTLAGSGGSGTYTTWAITTGTLPSGLTLDPATGIISGTTASNAASATFGVKVTDSLGVLSVEKSLTISIIAAKINQTITFGAISNQTYSATPFNIAPTSDSLLQVGVVSTTTAVCDVVANGTTWDVYMLSTGSCSLTASQAGNATYNAATDVIRSFTISKMNQTVTYAPPNKTFGDAAFVTNPDTSAAGEGLTPTFSGGTTNVCSINGTTGQITVLGAGTCSVQADYPGNSRYNSGSSGAVTFTIAKKDQTVSFSQSGKTFGDSSFGVTASTNATGGGTMSYSSSTTGVCTVSGSTVSIVAAGDCTLTASHTGNSNWNSGSANVTFAVAKKNQTVTFTQGGKTYGNADFVASASSDVTGAGVFSYTSSTTSVCTVTSAGSVSIVAAGDCTLGVTHPGNGNWNPGSASVTFTIAKKNQTVSFSQAGKTYGDADFTLGATTDATGSGTISYTSSTTSVCTVASNGIVSIVGAGNCTATASHPGNGNWNSGTSGPVTFAVAKKNQTVTMTTSSKSISDGTYDLTTVTSSDVTGGGTYTYSGGDGVTCSVASNGLVTFIAYGTCNVSVSHSGNANWNTGSTSASFSITNKLTQHVTFSQAGKTYGDTDFDAAATTDATGGGSLSYTSSTSSVCTVTSGGRVTITGAGDCTLTAAHPGNSTYNSGSASVTFVVGKKNQTVTFTQSGKTYGDADFSATATTDATGGGSMSYTSSTTGVCSVSVSGTVTIVAAGDCTLRADHPGNANWNSNHGSVTFAVARKNQSITFNQSGKTWGDASFGVSASTDATGGGSLSYSSSTTGVCTVSGSTVSIVAAGNCTLGVTHPGNGNWNPGSGSVTFAIAKKNQTVTFNQAGKKFGDTPFDASASTDADGGTFSFTSSTTSVCTVTSGGRITIVDVGNCTLTASHTGNGNWNPGSRPVTFAVGKGTPTLSLSQSNKTMGDPDFNVQVTNNASGGSTTYSSLTPSVCTVTSGGLVTLVSDGQCTIDATYGGSSQWDPGYTVTTFNVAVAPTPVAPAATTSTTSTTIAPATTTTVPLAAAGGNNTATTGSVVGVLWVDINKNGKKDKSEPPIPDITVELNEDGTLAASVRTASVRATALSTRTDATGKYVFLAVPVGSYKVEPILPKKVGLEAGTIGNLSGSVSVLPAKETIADVPAVGTSSTAGVTVDVSKNQPVNGAKVYCTWAGLDGDLGTNDDVEMLATSDDNGKFVLKGIPAGEYSCSWKNPVTGMIMDAETVKVLPATAKGSAVIQPTVTLHASTTMLAATGVRSLDALRTALLMLLAGLLLVRASRRRVGARGTPLNP